jgi:antitoxin CptB
MNHHRSACDRSQDNHSDIRCRRLLFRSWHRGTQESDLILGSFAETSLTGFNRKQLDRFEALLDCTDADLFDWIVAGGGAPPEHDHDVMRLLRGFCVRRQSRYRQNEQFRTATTTQEQA